MIGINAHADWIAELRRAVPRSPRAQAIPVHPSVQVVTEFDTVASKNDARRAVEAVIEKVSSPLPNVKIDDTELYVATIAPNGDPYEAYSFWSTYNIASLDSDDPIMKLLWDDLRVELLRLSRALSVLPETEYRVPQQTVRWPDDYGAVEFARIRAQIANTNNLADELTLVAKGDAARLSYCLRDQIIGAFRNGTLDPDIKEGLLHASDILAELYVAAGIPFKDLWKLALDHIETLGNIEGYYVPHLPLEKLLDKVYSFTNKLDARVGDCEVFGEIKEYLRRRVAGEAEELKNKVYRQFILDQQRNTKRVDILNHLKERSRLRALIAELRQIAAVLH